VWRFIRLLVLLSITAVTSIFVGIPTAVNRIADSWIEQATEGGIPLGFHPTLRTMAQVTASITLVLGWLIIASITVYIVRLIF
jgi:hypothetical protein